MTVDDKQQLRAAELAGVLLSLFATGLRMREVGWCVGELELNDVRLTQLGIERSPVISRQRRLLLLWRRWRHSRAGHDDGCVLVGVPRRVFPRLLRGWGQQSAVPFALELVDEVLAELHDLGEAPSRSGDEQPIDTVAYVVRRRITPTAPSTDTEPS